MFANGMMTLSKVTGRALGDEHAVVRAAWSMTGQITPAGGPAGVRSGIFLFVVVRQPTGNWLILSAQNTDIVSGAQTHVAANGMLRAESYMQRIKLNSRQEWPVTCALLPRWCRVFLLFVLSHGYDMWLFQRIKPGETPMRVP